MIKAVVFDLDDTLISESEYQRSANNAVFGHLSDLTGFPISVVRDHSARASLGPRTEYFQNLLPMLGLEVNQDSVSSLISFHREHTPELNWYPDVLEVVSCLKNEGAKLGIITDGYSVVQHQKLKAVQAEKFFDVVMVSDDLGREFWKPHPRVFNETALKLGILPHEMLYVGDNPAKDFYISKTLGVITARVIRNDSIKADLEYFEDVKENFPLKNFQSVVELFRNLKLN
ncbi:HAD-IA family hydrolase [Corynebacterium crudilactis]|uniref:HAD family hydrolase n=1 Tax=Corynebacterium crudilactis TaxID=1652495 RepID=A0A172QQX8_9CORY|nr:HAD-IA family hydrolase [Corynebacterium crudilactis]ANE03079.1 hypothetical protein ccrud_01855 [Corynebacterium crudilactis]